MVKGKLSNAKTEVSALPHWDKGKKKMSPGRCLCLYVHEHVVLTSCTV